jgi:hypothetical protein
MIELRRLGAWRRMPDRAPRFTESAFRESLRRRLPILLRVGTQHCD